MSKKLIVSGCSWGDPIFLSSSHPTMDTSWPKWPEILAEKMNLEPVNLCMSGMGQEYIYSSLSDALHERSIDSIGHVIAAWSSAPRRDWEKTENWRNPASNNGELYKRWNNDRTDARGDLRYWIRKSIRYQFAFQNLMEHFKTKVADQALFYNHIQMISLIKGHVWEVLNGIDYSSMAENNLQDRLDKLEKFTQAQKQGIKFMRDDMNGAYLDTLKTTKYKFNDKFLGWPTDEKLGGYTVESLLEEKHKISEMDRHPNKLGSERIAEIIYQKIHGFDPN